MAVNCLNKVKEPMGMRQRINVFKAIVRPHLTYCSTVWGARKNISDEAAKLERKAVRSIYDRRADVRSEEFMATHGITPIDKHIDLQYAVRLFKILNREKFALPDYLVDQLGITEARYGLTQQSAR